MAKRWDQPLIFTAYYTISSSENSTWGDLRHYKGRSYPRVKLNTICIGH
jgi:hypothetical protein